MEASLFYWASSYLLEHENWVYFRRAYSHPCGSPSGVPQALLPGPLYALLQMVGVVQYPNVFREISSISDSHKLDYRSLCRVSDIRDLGVFFDSKINFNIHIQMISSCVTKTLGMVSCITRKFHRLYRFITFVNSL